MNDAQARAALTRRFADARLSELEAFVEELPFGRAAKILELIAEKEAQVMIAMITRRARRTSLSAK